MSKTLLSLALSAAFPWWALPASAQDRPQSRAADEPPERTRSLGVVTVTGGAADVAADADPDHHRRHHRASRSSTRINATDSEDALKYLPEPAGAQALHRRLQPRRAVEPRLGHRQQRALGWSMPTASCCPTSSATASAGYFAPRWGLVTPEEIERVDVMYGPFSAAYPGNSVGAVVDYVTRMPTQFEAHAKVGYAVAAVRAVQHRRRPSAAGRPAPRSATAAATGRGGSTSTAPTATASR